MAPHVVNTSTDALLGSFIKCTAGSFLYTSLLIRYNLLAQTKWSDRTWHHWPAAALDSWSAVSPRALDHNLQILGIHRLCVSSQLSSHSDVSVWTVLGSVWSCGLFTHSASLALNNTLFQHSVTVELEKPLKWEMRRFLETKTIQFPISKLSQCSWY